MKTISLSRPVEFEGETVSVLSMREPKVRDLRDSEKGGGTAGDIEIRLLANLCMVSPEFVLDLPVADYGKMQAAYRDFTGPAPAS